MSEIKAIRMPKWGLAMEEGTIIEWLKQPGDMIDEGEEIVEIETTKISNVLEATNSGVLARIIGAEGDVLPVGSLIAVLTAGDVSDAEIDAFVADQPAIIAQDEDDDEVDTSTVRVIETGAYQINVASAGSGTPVILLHGFSGDLNNWMLLTDALKTDHQVIALDLPGHGASSKQVGDGSLATLAGAVAGTLDALGIAPAFVIGHSFGAAVAMQLALDHPSKVTALGLVSPAGLPGTTVSDDFLDGIVEAERAKDVKAALKMLFADEDMVGRDMVDGVARYLRLDGARDALATLRARMREGADFAALQSRYDDLPPVTLLHGTTDAIVGLPDPAALPDSWKIHAVPGAAHMPHLESAEFVTSALKRAIAP